MNVYSLRNRLISAYTTPLYAVEDKGAFAESQRRFIKLQPVEAKKAHLDECELYFLGTFDDVSCKFSLLDQPDFVCDLGQFFDKVGDANA